jgi:hypothetical protein
MTLLVAADAATRELARRVNRQTIHVLCDTPAVRTLKVPCLT